MCFCQITVVCLFICAVAVKSLSPKLKMCGSSNLHSQKQVVDTDKVSLEFACFCSFFTGSSVSVHSGDELCSRVAESLH